MIVKIKQKRNKMWLCMLFCMVLGLTACYGAMPLESQDDGQDDGKIQVLCTTFPLYDWTRQIVGDSDTVTVSLLLDNGVDMHSYQASAADIAKITSCDMLVYVGGTSDVWLSDMLRKNADEKMAVVNLTEVLKDNVREEELAEGMQNQNHSEDQHDEEYDEHLWLSVKNAVLSCEAVKNGLCSVDAANADSYDANCRAYTERLSQLDAEYADMVKNAEKNTVLFADRFAFLYLMKDYDIGYYAAFPGCSSETTASFETVAFLAGKLKEEHIGCVLTLENAENGFALELAQTVIKNAGVEAKILSMDSMQSVTRAQIDAGMTYYDVMEHNLLVLKEAMNEKAGE